MMTDSDIKGREVEDLDPTDEAKAYQECFRSRIGATDAAGIVNTIMNYERDPERVKSEFTASLAVNAKITCKSIRFMINCFSLPTLPTPFQAAVKEGKTGLSQGYLFAANLDPNTGKFYEVFQSIMEQPVTSDELKNFRTRHGRGRNPHYDRGGKNILPKRSISQGIN